MKSFYDMVEQFDRQLADWVATLPEVLPEDLGLDRRCGYRIYVAEDGLVVPKYSDRSLQYYGGFEYVDKDCRIEYGDWVFYSCNDDRVNACMDRFEEEVVDG